MGNGKTTDLAPVLCLSLPRKPNPNRSNSARRRSPGTNQSRVSAQLNETAVNVTFPASLESEEMRGHFGRAALARWTRQGAACMRG